MSRKTGFLRKNGGMLASTVPPERRTNECATPMRLLPLSPVETSERWSERHAMTIQSYLRSYNTPSPRQQDEMASYSAYLATASPQTEPAGRMFRGCAVEFSFAKVFFCLSLSSSVSTSALLSPLRIVSVAVCAAFVGCSSGLFGHFVQRPAQQPADYAVAVATDCRASSDGSNTVQRWCSPGPAGFRPFSSPSGGLFRLGSPASPVATRPVSVGSPRSAALRQPSAFETTNISVAHVYESPIRRGKLLGGNGNGHAPASPLAALCPGSAAIRRPRTTRYVFAAHPQRLTFTKDNITFPGPPPKGTGGSLGNAGKSTNRADLKAGASLNRSDHLVCAYATGGRLQGWQPRGSPRGRAMEAASLLRARRLAQAPVTELLAEQLKG
eukprot:SAG31_NODE_6931_length_1845_cov_226.393471_1_plen_383_part_10